MSTVRVEGTVELEEFDGELYVHGEVDPSCGEVVEATVDYFEDCKYNVYRDEAMQELLGCNDLYSKYESEITEALEKDVNRAMCADMDDRGDWELQCKREKC